MSLVLVAHKTMSLEKRTFMGSAAKPVPLVAAVPAPAVAPHNEPTRRVAPILPKNRRSSELI